MKRILEKLFQTEEPISKFNEYKKITEEMYLEIIECSKGKDPELFMKAMFRISCRFIALAGALNEKPNKDFLEGIHTIIKLEIEFLKNLLKDDLKNE